MIEDIIAGDIWIDSRDNIGKKVLYVGDRHVEWDSAGYITRAGTLDFRIRFHKKNEVQSLETAFDDNSPSDLDIDPQLQEDGSYKYIPMPLPNCHSAPPIPPMKANDHQVGGNHYKKKAIEPWDYAIANNLGFLEGSIIKYITRHGDKNGLEDVKKALHYIQKLIETYKDEKK